MGEILDAIVGIYEFVTTGIWEGIKFLFAYAVQWVVVAYIKLKAAMTVILWDVSKNILANLGVSDLIETYWGSLDPVLLDYLTFFKLPEALNIILQAHITKFGLRLFF